MDVKRESFIFYESYFKAADKLPPEEFKNFFGVLVRYALYGEEPGNDDYLSSALLAAMRPSLDRSIKNYENGKKGGRPPKATETEPKPNETEPKPNETEEKQTKGYYSLSYSLSSSLSSSESDDLTTFDHCAADAPRHAEKEDSEKKRKKETDETITEKCRPIVDYLNEKVGTHYRPQTKGTQSHISARMREGYTFEDFKTVIDKKAEEWSGTEFATYLTPDTLFGAKFEKYLNATPRPKAPEPKIEHLLDGIL